MSEHTAQQLGHVPLNDKSRSGPDSPIEHAFAPQPEYQFTLQPIQNSTSAPLPIDPALLPLPGSPDIDLRDGLTIANTIGLKRAEKVGGSCHKGKEHVDPKGKKRQRVSSISDNDSEPVAKHRCPHGSTNYGKDNVCKMFNFVAELLPVGQKGWKEALENKYKQARKHTSSASCPPEVKHAHEIEDLINQHVGTRELSDSEFNDWSDNGSSDDDIKVVEHTADKQAIWPCLESR
ncbi:hypothetical protein B0H14DRAFT_3460693 [Mycena olivaceomarginata]|nr:hypothetical protein B0H14DRAFT_3460693 [Mycena olivaceomarginata]